MLQVFAGTKPVTIYLNRGRVLKYWGDGKASIMKLGPTIKEKEMARVSQALRRLFRKLTQLSLSFSIRAIQVEQDPEVEAWRYVVAEIELKLPPRLFLLVDAFLIEYVYSLLSPRQSTKLLLIFHNV